MNTHKRIANKGFEEEAVLTSSDFLGRPLSKSLRRIKTLRNRAAKRRDARDALKEAS